MNINEWLKKKTLKWLGLEKLADNPKGERYTYVNDMSKVYAQEIKANKCWYVGNSNELLNYYTNEQLKGFADNPIYNRNMKQYFWALSTEECEIKRVHSGVPKAIITSITNIVGMPDIKEQSGLWEKIAYENNFTNLLSQNARPMTLAVGYGAFKVNLCPEISKYPLIEYYDAENIEYMYKAGMLIGIVFKSYYKDKKGKDLMLCETRSKENGNSYISYNLFRVISKNEVEEISLNEVDELKDLENQEFKGLDRILAVPLIYFNNPQRYGYGQSIYAGKIDLFDMLDEVVSQASATNRVSTPVEYISVDVIERGKNGEVGLPNIYNRKFIQTTSVPNGDGVQNQDIITTQPQLNFAQYSELFKDILDYALLGKVSPASLGIDIARKDNAMAQREKEKATLFTVQSIEDNEQRAIRSLVEICLISYNYMTNAQASEEGVEFDNPNFDVQVKYDEFGSPTEETKYATLTPVLTQMAMTPELFVEKVYGDSLTEDKKLREIEYIKEKLQSDQFTLNDIEGDINERTINGDVSGLGNEEEETETIEESISNNNL